MTKLSVNINKVALLRNARGSNIPDLIQFAKDCESFGAQGITVHPRPDQRHIKYDDIAPLKEVVTTEFNIEGYPSRAFMDLVIANRPHQCTLVPDPPEALTSDSGWDTIANEAFLIDIISELKSNGIRVSLFLNPENKMADGAAKVGTDRVELYTGKYATLYNKDKKKAIEAHANLSQHIKNLNLGLNAGHDLDLTNLRYYVEGVTNLLEVSIGHALIKDSLYYGIHNTIQMYLLCLEHTSSIDL